MAEISGLGLGFIIGGSIIFVGISVGFIVWMILSHRRGTNSRFCCFSGQAEKNDGSDNDRRNERADMRPTGRGRGNMEEEAIYSTVYPREGDDRVQVGANDCSTLQVRPPKAFAPIQDDGYHNPEDNDGPISQPSSQDYTVLGDVKRDTKNVYDSLPRDEEDVASAPVRPQSLSLQPMGDNESSNDWIVTPFGAVSPNPSQDYASDSSLGDNSIIVIRPSPEEPNEAAKSGDSGVNSENAAIGEESAVSVGTITHSQEDNENDPGEFKRVKDDSGNYSSSDAYVVIEKRNGVETVVFAERDNDTKSGNEEKASNDENQTSAEYETYTANDAQDVQESSAIDSPDYVSQ